jgi:hypothetical protein
LQLRQTIRRPCYQLDRCAVREVVMSRPITPVTRPTDQGRLRV